MSCNCQNNLCERNCTPCNDYCTPCMPIYSPVTEYFSQKYHQLEHNYPLPRCKCNNFATKTRYYNKPHVSCNCRDKCYPC